MDNPSIYVRVVSLSPTASDVIAHIGALDELVGVSSYCLPFLGERRRVVGSYTTVSLRALRELAPDLVFLESAAQDGLKEVIEGAGFRVALLPFPSSLGAVLDQVIRVGTLVGRYSESRELAERLREGIVQVAKGGGSRPRVYVEFWLGRGEDDRRAAGPLTYVDEMIYVTGGLNAVRRPSGFVGVDPAEVARVDPDLIIFHLDPWLRMEPGILEKRGWTGVSAARNGDVHVVWESNTVNLAHHGPSTLLTSLRWLSSLIERAAAKR